MIGSFLAKLFGQVVQPLQPTDLRKEPLLIAFLCLLQALPCTGYVLNKKKIKVSPHHSRCFELILPCKPNHPMLVELVNLYSICHET